MTGSPDAWASAAVLGKGHTLTSFNAGSADHLQFEVFRTH